MSIRRLVAIAVAVGLPTGLALLGLAGTGLLSRTQIGIGSSVFVLSLGGSVGLIWLRDSRRRISRLEARLAELDRRPSGSELSLRTRDLIDAGGTQWRDGLPVPPLNLRFMAETPERYLRTGRELADTVLAHAPDGPFDLLDVGSGYGRLAVGFLGRGADALHSYVGFDILERHVRWCNLCLTTIDSRFVFLHLDVANERYNAQGKIAAENAEFPVTDQSVDVVALFSVFTHLYRPDVERYLAECFRVLRPGGMVVSTWLTFDEARLPIVQSQGSTYPLAHLLPDGSRYMDPSDPLRAIGFRESAVHEMVGAHGFTAAGMHRGSWTGETTSDPQAVFQDLLVATKPR